MLNMNSDLDDSKTMQFRIETKEMLMELKRQLLSEKFHKDKNDSIKFEVEICLDTYNEESIKELEGLTQSIPENALMTVIINDKNSTIKCSELNKFIDLEDSFKSRNIELLFDGGLQKYNLHEVINAQKQIEDFANKIKSLDASLLEKYLIIYDFLTSKIYKESKNSAESRDIISVLNGDSIVCVGYAQLMIRLCKEVGIECYEQGCSVYSKENGKNLERHANNIVKIKDEKYGIDGVFYADACWDSVKKGAEKKKTYSYCLIPLEDKDNMVYESLEMNGASKFFYNTQIESFLCYMESYNLQDYGINSDVDFDNKFFLNKERRVRACDRLKNIFQENNIPANIYSMVKEVPEICSLERMLALCMEEDIDEKRIQESIVVMKKMAEMGEKFDRYKEGLISYSSKDIKDVYEELEEYSTSETGFTDMSIEEILEMKRKYDIETIKKMLGNSNNLPNKWNKIVTAYSRIEQEREIKQAIQQIVGKSDKISLDIFEEALIKSYQLRGMDLETAEDKAFEAIGNTIEKSNKIFNTNAKNCFKQFAIEFAR